MNTTANGNIMTGTATNKTDWAFAVDYKPPRYVMHMTSQYVIYHNEQPSAWVRFWQRTLLGWTWEKLE